MRLSRALKQKNLDLRLRDKLVAEGKLTQDQVSKYLTDLSDDTVNMTTTSDEKKESDVSSTDTEQVAQAPTE